MLTPVGLDLSLTSTGFSCGDTRAAIFVKATGPERLFLIAEKVIELLSYVKGSPIVIVEGYSFASRNSQAHSIGELGGVIRLELWKRGVPYIEVPPTVRAKFATGKGNASKGEVLSSVSARTGIVWEGKGADDMCDAFVLEEIGLAKLNSARYNWPAANLSALEKIDWTPLENPVDNGSQPAV